MAPPEPPIIRYPQAGPFLNGQEEVSQRRSSQVVHLGLGGRDPVWLQTLSGMLVKILFHPNRGESHGTEK